MGRSYRQTSPLKANQPCGVSQHDRLLTLCILAGPILFGFNLTCRFSMSTLRYEEVGDRSIIQWLHQSRMSNVSCVTRDAAPRRRKNLIFPSKAILFISIFFVLFVLSKIIFTYISHYLTSLKSVLYVCQYLLTSLRSLKLFAFY